MKRLFSILFTFPLIFFASCYVAPAPVFRLETLSNKNVKVWLQGKEFTKLAGKNLDLIIAFDEVNNNLITFDIEVINHNPEPRIISPELFKEYSLDNTLMPLKSNTNYLAVNPEDKLLQMDKALSKENARYAGESGTKAFFSLFELVGDVASIGRPKTDEEIKEKSHENVRKEIQDIKDDNYHSGEIRNLTNERSKWSFSALRKTTLPVNHSVSGKIFLPLIYESHFLRLVFDEENENLNIVFRINKY